MAESVDCGIRHDKVVELMTNQLFFVVLAVTNLTCVVVATEVARKKGFKRKAWFLGAAIFGPFVLPLLFFLKSKA